MWGGKVQQAWPHICNLWRPLTSEARGPGGPGGEMGPREGDGLEGGGRNLMEGWKLECRGLDYWRIDG